MQGTVTTRTKSVDKYHKARKLQSEKGLSITKSMRLAGIHAPQYYRVKKLLGHGSLLTGTETSAPSLEQQVLESNIPSPLKLSILRVLITQ